jgi:uncharacterized protein involved in exopolysaccharide biosynthesis
MLDVLKPDPVTGEVISSSFARAFVPTQTELIRDYRVTGRVVDRMGMLKSSALQAQYDASAKGGTDFRRWIANQISDNIQATNLQGSNVVVISYAAGDPETAANMANAVRDAYVEETVGSRRGDAAQTANFFERQLGDVRGQLTAAEERKVAFERANNIVLLADDSDADSARLQAVAGSAPPPATVVGGGGGGGGGAAESAQLAAIDAKIAAASATLGPNHPVLQDLRAQRAAASSAASRARSGGGGGVKIIGGGGGDIAGARARVLAQRDKVEEAKRLQSDVSVLRDQYTKMAARAADLRQQAASNESGITLLDSAVQPRQPDPPAPLVIVAGALVSGLALGILLSLGFELLYRRVRGIDDLTGLDVPIIGVINKSPATT